MLLCYNRERAFSMDFVDLLLLYIAFQLKHLLCDFIQPYWVATGKGKSLAGVGGKALSFHAGAHAAGTLLLTLIFAPVFWWLAIVDFVIHSTVDRAKSLIIDQKKWPLSSKKYWFAFGADQLAHHMTHLAYIVFIFTSLNPELTLL